MKYFLLLVAFSFSAFSFSQLNQVWVNNYNGIGDYSDKANDMVTDGSGNIYIGGYTTTNGNRDYLTIKMNASGDTTWTRIYNGEGNSADEVNAIAIDASGNVYVTGYSKSNDNGDDYVTIKYNSSGAQQWIAVFNGANNEDDEAHDIAVDAAGNVFVTGSTQVDVNGLNEDFATVKYNSSGAQQWLITYNAPGNSIDFGKRIVLDADGNPIVMGQGNNGSDDDWLVFKYRSTNGSQVWLNYLDYTKNDKPGDMVRDASGNIYVTGRAKATNYDIATRKIDTAGATIWTKFFQGTDDDRGEAVTVDASENIYVAGITDVNINPSIYAYNIIVLKYNSAGTQQFVTTYNGTGNGDDLVNSVSVNTTGEVFVCGQTDVDATSAVNFEFVKLGFNSFGTKFFEKVFTGNGTSEDNASVVIASSGTNILSAGGAFTSSNNKNLLVIKYDSAGTELFSKSYNGIGDNNDAGNVIGVDNNGNSFAAGYSVNLSEDKNMLLTKIDGNGNSAWTNTYTGTSGVSPDEVTDAATDANGNAYTTGFAKDSAESYNFYTSKYDAGGTLLWRQKYNYGNGSDKAAAIAVDGNGNVFVTGRSDSDSSSLFTNYDITTIKYNSAGVQQWVQRYNKVGASADEPVDVAVSTAGNVFVTGRSNSGTDDDIVTISYSAGGVPGFGSVEDGTGNYRSEKILMDNSENTYVCGRITHLGQYNGFLAKYSSAGVQGWARTWTGASNGTDRFDAMVFDDAGNIWVAGRTDPDGDTMTINNDYLIAKYDTAGILLWDTTWSHSSTSDDAASAIAYYNGNIFITGESNFGTTAITNYNYFTLQIDTAGNIISSAIYDQTGGDDKPRAITANSAGIFVTGASTGSGTQYDAVTVKYDLTIGINEVKDNFPLHVYPIPFSEKTFIELPFVIDGIAELNDVSGKLLRSISFSEKTFELKRGELAPGIYILKILNEEGMELGETKIVVR